MSELHILNGQALKERFPKISGHCLSFDEILIEGPVKNLSLESFAIERQKYLETNYGAAEEEVVEFYRLLQNSITRLNDDSSIYLWFEQDLFCQTNFWFVCYLILKLNSELKVYWVSTDEKSPYGFSNYSNLELIKLYEESQLCKLDFYALCWALYSESKFKELSEELKTKDLNLAKLVLEQLPLFEENTLAFKFNKQWVKNHNETFVDFFKAFQSEFSELGLGDLQVKRLFYLV